MAHSVSQMHAGTAKAKAKILEEATPHMLTGISIP
jgi:hypothetical protein